MAYLGREPAYGSFEKQSITADSSTTTFTLNFTVGSSSSIMVSVAGVFQEPEVAYNLSDGGTKIVFTAAPATGDTCFIVFLGIAYDVGTLVGTGVTMLSDDGDPTKSNVGEYSGSILSSAGTGASVGSMLGPVGTAVGAGVGAIYGAAKQYFGTRKAKRAQERADKERMARVGKYNKEVSQNLASANMQARSGEIEQKTYSGYDLGRNVVAQLGGMRMGIPRYA